MATFKVIVQKQRNDGFWPVYIRITHNRGVKYIRTDKIVDSKGVDKKNREVKDPFVLQSCSARIAKFAELLNKVEIRKWSVHDVVAYLEKGTADICFSDYARKYHDEMYNDGHERNARNYELAYQHLERYAGSNKVMFSQLTTQFINGWIKALSKTARAKEMYPVCVRQIFKQALAEFNDYDNGMIRITTNPWLKVKIPSSDVPEKKAITMEEVRAFFAAPLPESDRVFPLPELGRDVAMMVMCLAGINTVDIYRLKKEDYHDGIIGYERAKTRNARRDNAYIEMRVPGIILPLFEKYLDKTESPYLFNFNLRMTSSDSFGADVNIGIRNVCELSLGMQHADRYRVTRTYVKLDFTPAWELNEKVVEKIFFTEDRSTTHVSDEKGDHFERFSYKQLIKGTLYYRGKALVKVEDVGFNNVNDVIEYLMARMPDTVPARAMVQISFENKDKGQTKDYSRIVK